MCPGRGAVVGDHHSFAAGQPIVLDHIVRAEAVQGGFDLTVGKLAGQLFAAGGSHPGRGHDILGECLGALDAGSCLIGPEHQKPCGSQRIGNPRHQGNFRANDHQVSGNVARQRHHGVRIVDAGDLAVECGQRFHADVTGGNVNIVDGGIVKQA